MFDVETTGEQLHHASIMAFTEYSEEVGVLGQPWINLFDKDAVRAAYLAITGKYGLDVQKSQETTKYTLAHMIFMPVRRLLFIVTNLADEGEEAKVYNQPMQACLRAGIQLEDIMNELTERWATFHRVVSQETTSETVEGNDWIELTQVCHTEYSDGEKTETRGEPYRYHKCEVSTKAWQKIMGDVLRCVWRETVQEKDVKSLSFDGETIVLGLSNGRVMALTSSEWASVDPRQNIA
jgi:hypothetical protein